MRIRKLLFKRTTLIKALPYTLSAMCIVYLLWGIDSNELAIAFRALSSQSVVVAQCILLLSFIPSSFRLALITNNEADKMTSFRAVAVGIATNTLLPLRLGEVAKVFVLNRNAHMPIERAMRAVFWERLADLNCLLLLALATVSLLDVPVALLPLSIIVGLLWASLYCLKTRPHWFATLTARLPSASLKNFCNRALAALSESRKISYYFKIAAYTITIWLVFMGFIYYLVSTGTGLDLNNGQIMTVILASILGVAIPSAPAGIGVYESLVAGALIVAGASKEQALAIAVVLHILQLLIPTLIGLLFMPVALFRLRELHRKAD
ncbi:MAG: lysylphosphatidylglycerol synthase transmembrane domain-containing protein [Pseudomonadota bacterium]